MKGLNVIGLLALMGGVIFSFLGWNGSPIFHGGISIGYTNLDYEGFIGYILLLIAIIVFIISWIKRKNQNFPQTI